MKYAGYKVKENQKISLKNTNKEEFYYFLGLLITDGHLEVNKKGGSYKAKLYTSYEEEKDIIIQLIKELFDYKASIRERTMGFEKRINYEIYISSKELTDFLMNKVKFPAGAKSLTAYIPEIIIKARDSEIASFIRGVIDGDGTINKGYTVKIPSGSKKFIEDMKLLLDRLKISSGRVIRERENLYVLWACGRENTIRLREILYEDAEFYYKRKFELWNQYV
jgi:intein/homing endonuclease